ncbi:MAG: fasciclin domain-containing protein [Hyphomicrobium sp.]
MHRIMQALAVAVLSAVGSLAASAEETVTAPNLKAVAAGTGQLTRMAEITKLAGLDGASSGIGQLTLFAPSDAAFEALPERFKAAILKPENRLVLVDLLLHHAIIGKYSTRRLLKARAKHYGVEAADGTLIEFTIRRELDVHGARITHPDLEASNGVLHIIDKVLVPKSVAEAIDASIGQQTADADSDAIAE